MPKRFKNSNISIIRIAESPTLVKKVNFCWSRPFNMPSDIASRYIKGTIGESTLSKKPTSGLLYIKIPRLFPPTKKSAENIIDIILVVFMIL